MIRKSTSLLSGILMLLIVPSFSQAEPALNGARIEGFLASMPQLEKLGEKYDLEEEDAKEAAENMAEGEFSPFTSSLGTLKKHKAYGEFMNIIRNAGFSSAEEWANVGDRVMRAYISSEMRRENPGARAEMQEALKEVQNNPHISAEQKQAIIANIQQGMGMLSAIGDAPAEDIQAIQPYLGQLESLSKEMQ